MPPTPKYLLFTESLKHATGGRLWRFLLVTLGPEGESSTVSGSDLVEGTTALRAELLALVRGLEAIDGSGEVKLFSGSGHIRRGMTRGLAQWKLQGWHWERFGRRVPVRDCDLWQRVDHALQFHTVECQAWGDTSETSQTYLSDENFDIEKNNEPAVAMASKPRRRITIRNRFTGLKEQVHSIMEPALAAG